MHTIKASKYLANSQHTFQEVHLSIAKKIHDKLQLSQWLLLGELLKSLTESDKEKVHFAFYDLYGYDYELKMRSMIGSYRKLRQYGLG